MTDESLKRLRAVMGEAYAELANAPEIDIHKFAGAFLERNRPLVIEALAGMVPRAIEEANDLELTTRVFKQRPELQDRMEDIPLISETLGIPMHVLLELGDEQFNACCGVAASSRHWQTGKFLRLLEQHTEKTTGKLK
jgi:hypothetical protein